MLKSSANMQTRQIKEGDGPLGHFTQGERDKDGPPSFLISQDHEVAKIGVEKEDKEGGT